MKLPVLLINQSKIMKFSIPQAEFLKGLTLSNKSLLTKANLPILSNILVTAEKNKVEIVTTNLETATKVSLGAEVEKEGRTTLLGRTIGEFVQQLDSGNRLTFEKLGEEAVVGCGRYNARFATMDASEFPVIPKVGSGLKIKVKGKNFSEGILKVAFCAAQDESRPILTGVLCEIVKSKLKLVATDGYRLGFCEIDTQKSESAPATTFIIPAKALLEVAKIISEEAGDSDKKEGKNTMSFVVSQNLTQVVFMIGKVEFTSRLIEGEFPNWQKIIPTSFITKSQVSKTEFARAIKMASIFARESGNIIKLNLESGQNDGASLTVNAITAQVGSASGKIDVKLDGKGGEIAFNFRYLLDVLSVLPDEEVFFEMNESLNPGKITGSGDGSKSFHIIMPVRLQG